MREGFLSNSSRFGQLMTRAGILIAANLLFLMACMPVVTAGAGLAALHHTVLRMLRGDGEINPFREFWHGFKGNLRQATIAFAAIVLLTAFLLLEIFWCTQFVGLVAYFRYGLYMILLVELLLSLYLFPTMAAFDAPLGRLTAHSFFFVMKRPLTALVVALIHIVPVLLTVVHVRFLPLYAFVWCMIGAAAIATCCDSMLLKIFIPYLPQADVCGEIIPEGMEADFVTEADQEKKQQRTLEDMMKLGM